MTLHNFRGNTFVAYMDISGFKNLSQKGKAYNMIRSFYGCGYRLLKKCPYIKGLFISDCGILFVDSDINANNFEHHLSKLLDIVKRVNMEVVNEGYMLTTSIAYGDFNYENMDEFDGVSKNPLYGDAYTNAFLDNDNGEPKIRPGECRIVNKDCEEIELFLNKKDIDTPFGHLKKHNDYYYFYWMVENPLKIKHFKKSYDKEYKRDDEERFDSIRELLKKYN